MNTLIEVKEIGKYFGPVKAVDGVSFSVGRGEVLGFLGPNGAGKTTTMRLLTCFLVPSFGTAAVCGHDVISASLAVRRRIGYLPENAPAYGEMRVIDFLRFIADVRGLKGQTQKKQLADIIDKVSIKNVLHQSIDTLSKGYQRRVGLATALLHDPEVLILDEPTDGLDPNQKFEVRQLITQIAAQKAIIVSTHILEEVDAVCSRMIIIDKGKLVADDTPVKLKERSRYHGLVSLGVRKSKEGNEAGVLGQIPGVEKVDVLAGTGEVRSFVIHPRQGEEIAHSVARTAHERGWIVEQFSVDQGRLDDVFRSITEQGEEISGRE